MNGPNRVVMYTEHKERKVTLKNENLTTYSKEMIIEFIILWNIIRIYYIKNQQDAT